MQVDDLIEAVTDKSMKLLAQRHAELQQCEFLGDEILQSSKQFQRISKRTMRKYKVKNVNLKYPLNFTPSPLNQAFFSSSTPHSVHKEVETLKDGQSIVSFS
ncbi:putative uncharacterized protein C3orf49 homolog isoform X1 [Orcinus orca]|uniref:putative uncharacterized protein C3orf49 homolog isoform X1 n=1 Tax=Orcinus orca TaxID=9733 RepID=UPI00211166F6|nr:putative uncharacterized protein C3orf49 homolog isoform X1 [Orcinus orca]